MAESESSDHEARIEKLEEQLARDPMKAAVKAALKEWLDEKFAEVGKWSVRGILAAALAALAYFILTYHGWRHGP
jgi:hypothetical protein